MWFTFVTARLLIFLSFQPRLTAALLRSCSVVNSPIRRAGLSPAFQPASLAQRLIRFDHFEICQCLAIKANSRRGPFLGRVPSPRERGENSPKAFAH